MHGMEVGKALEGFATHESNLLLTQRTRNVVDVLYFKCQRRRNTVVKKIILNNWFKVF